MTNSFLQELKDNLEELKRTDGNKVIKDINIFKDKYPFCSHKCIVSSIINASLDERNKISNLLDDFKEFPSADIIENQYIKVAKQTIVEMDRLLETLRELI